MAADDFFQRWAKHNAEWSQTPAHNVHSAGRSTAQPPVHASAAISAKQKADTLPTLDDVAALTPESDYSPFVMRGVDQAVQRSALKKLFSDPHFNLMDGLDTYIDDYNKFVPIPPEMLALLNHAQDLLNPLARLDPPQPERPPIERPRTGSIAADEIPEDAGQASGAPPSGSESQENPLDELIVPADQCHAARAPASIPPPNSA
jgi:hypothetical protein